MAEQLWRSIRSLRRKTTLLDLKSISRRNIEKSMNNRVGPALVKSHELIVADWKSDIGFEFTTNISGRGIEVIVFPTGADKEIWEYVDQGTPAHTISNVTPKNASALKFKAGGKYNPKTLASPARTVSGGGTVTGGTQVFTKRVDTINHPGSKGRFFSKQIAEDILPQFRREIENAFRQIAIEADP